MQRRARSRDGRGPASYSERSPGRGSGCRVSATLVRTPATRRGQLATGVLRRFAAGLTVVIGGQVTSFAVAARRLLTGLSAAALLSPWLFTAAANRVGS